ncbi:uncharacterized protein [Eurosta solidaginis]|uniref:uncharacterized protein isoform X2 n=1 Tax=Eurosta solidaginis TaxID=178769 RepID=UPI0035312937
MEALIVINNCLEMANFINLFLSMAAYLSNSSDNNQYPSWLSSNTKPSRIKSNVTIKTNTKTMHQSSKAATVSANYFYLKQSMNDDVYNYRLSEINNIVFNIFNQIQGHGNESGGPKKLVYQKQLKYCSSNFYYCNFMQQWKQETGALKNNQDFYDDVYEIIVYMLFATLAEVIPLALGYVWKLTSFYWCRLQLFFYCCQRSVRSLFLKEQLQHQYAIAVYYVCVIQNLSNITIINKQHLNLMRQKQLKKILFQTRKILVVSDVTFGITIEFKYKPTIPNITKVTIAPKYKKFGQQYILILTLMFRTSGASTYIRIQDCPHLVFTIKTCKSRGDRKLYQRIENFLMEVLNTLRSQKLARKKCISVTYFSTPFVNLRQKSIATTANSSIVLKLRKRQKICPYTIIKLDLGCCCWGFYCLYFCNNCKKLLWCQRFVYTFLRCIYCYYIALSLHCCSYCICYYYTHWTTGHLFILPSESFNWIISEPQKHCYMNYQKLPGISNTDLLLPKTMDMGIYKYNIQHLDNSLCIFSFEYIFVYYVKQRGQRLWCNAANILQTKAEATVNDHLLINKKNRFVQYVRCSLLYLGKYIFHKLINLMEFISRLINSKLRKKLFVSGSQAIVIKITRNQQKQHFHILCITYDQQFKINNLCRFFCNNWKRHRRRRRRRRRQRITKCEQRKVQHVTLQLSQKCHSKDHLLPSSDISKIMTSSMTFWLMILRRRTTGSISTLMQIGNPYIALNERTDKELVNPPSATTLTLDVTTTTNTTTMTLHGTIMPSTGRINRSRARPNLVWLFIGLVWFECQKCVNCSINRNSQSEHPTQAQTQVNTRSALHTSSKESLNGLSSSADNYHQQKSLPHKVPPSRISSKLVLHTRLNKTKNPLMQDIVTVATFSTPSFKFNIKEENTNANFKSICSDQNVSLNIRASSITEGTNNCNMRSQNVDSIVMTERVNHDWLESYIKGDAFPHSLDEEENKSPSDRARLESIKKQILTKLGLKQRPNIWKPLPKQFIWDTIYRADGITSVISDFDFNDARERKVISINKKVPFHLAGSRKEEYKIGMEKYYTNYINRNREYKHSISRARSRSFIFGRSGEGVARTSNSRFYQRTQSNSHSTNQTPFYTAVAVGNRNYNLRNTQFDKPNKINDGKIRINVTYLSESNINEEFVEVQLAKRNEFYDHSYSNIKNYEGYMHRVQKNPAFAEIYENEDSFGDAQEIITFAERVKKK